MRNRCLLGMEGVSYYAGGKAIVKDIDLGLCEGKSYAMVGPSGSGKTTILMLLNGLISPSEGKISFEGGPIEEMNMPEYRSKASLMFQEPLLMPGSGRDNLMLPFSLAVNVERRPSEDMLTKVLKDCGLNDGYLDKDVSTLSGGEKQRLSLARTLLLKPRVLMLDEPTSALDMMSEKQIISTLKDCKKDSLILYVTHSYQLVKGADEIIIINGGRISSIVSDIDRCSLEEFMEVSK